MKKTISFSLSENATDTIAREKNKSEFIEKLISMYNKDEDVIQNEKEELEDWISENEFQIEKSKREIEKARRKILQLKKQREEQIRKESILTED